MATKLYRITFYNIFLFSVINICRTNIKFNREYIVTHPQFRAIHHYQIIGRTLKSMYFFKFSNRHSLLKSMVVSNFLKTSQIHGLFSLSQIDVTDICPNPNQ